jgi:hypothetical protein
LFIISNFLYNGLNISNVYSVLFANPVNETGSVVYGTDCIGNLELGVDVLYPDTKYDVGATTPVGAIIVIFALPFAKFPVPVGLSLGITTMDDGNDLPLS